MTVVKSSPVRVARKGFVREASRSTICGTSLMPAMEEDMVLRPRKSTPKPIMISANFFTCSFPQNMAVSTPARRITGA